MHFHDDLVLYYNIYGDNITRNAEERNRFFVRAIKRSLDRRRQGRGGDVKQLAKLFSKG